MTNKQFLDGLALSGILPAPLIIFATFVGCVGGGSLGALALTIGIFAPAFSFSLVGHKYLEKVVENKALHIFNDGVTAGVVGLIAATTIGLLKAGITNHLCNRNFSFDHVSYISMEVKIRCLWASYSVREPLHCF